MNDEAERSKESFKLALEKISTTKRPRIARMLQSIRSQKELSTQFGNDVIRLINETAECNQIAKDEGNDLIQREALGAVVSVVATVISIAIVVSVGKRVIFNR